MSLRVDFLMGCLCLGLIGSVGAGEAAAPIGVKRWLSSVLAKIEAADRSRAAGQNGGRSAVVGVRVRVGEDGSVLAVEVEKGSGTSSLDERAVAAIKAAGPFAPPPAQTLMPNGTTELSFPLTLPGQR